VFAHLYLEGIQVVSGILLPKFWPVMINVALP